MDGRRVSAALGRRSRGRRGQPLLGRLGRRWLTLMKVQTREGGGGGGQLCGCSSDTKQSRFSTRATVEVKFNEVLERAGDIPNVANIECPPLTRGSAPEFVVKQH